MITLKYVKVEQFRSLRDVELHFPQRGSILITGPNEAGKSTLLESIYFALYGESLAQPRGKRPATLDELVRYGEKRAVVTLALSIGATEITITREIEREKGQSIVVQVRKLGMPAEKPVTDLQKANQRIITELGRMDGKTLRNSCFIEQRGLDRLEQLSGREREAALHHLLGLEKLARLAEQFSLGIDDERRLAETTLRLRLAEVQARIPELSSKLGDLEAALDAVSVNEDLAAIVQQEADIEEQQQELEHIEARRTELKNSQARISQLNKAGLIIDEIIAAYDTIAEAQRELPELEHQIVELERREREELPVLEQRVRELADLTRSFGTLERMASDLLNAVNTIKELEQGIKQQEHLEETLADLDGQIAYTRQLVEETRQGQHELEEQHRSTRPQLEERQKRLQALAEKLTALSAARQTRASRDGQRQQANENFAQIAKLREELSASEQELALVEKEAQQTQENADAQEKRWRQLSIRHQVQEWHRLKNLSRGLTDAQQHVEAADRQREQLNSALLATRRSATTQLGIFIACITLAVLSGGGALVEALRQGYAFATIAGMAALVLGAIGGVNLQTYGKTREEERLLDHQLQEANNQVGMMVAAREAALRLGGSQEELAPIEHEIRSLGGSVPGTLEEAQYLLQQAPAHDESIADEQQRLTETRSAAAAARGQVSVTMEAVAALRKEKARLQELRQQEGWDDFDARLRADQAAIESLQNEITAAAGQEGLPIPNFSDQEPESQEQPEAELKSKLDETIEATAFQMAAIDDRMDNLPDVATKVKLHQDTLDALLARKLSLVERHEQLESSDPMRQIEQARQQQLALREALRALQDSLRERVVPLGVSFGQTAISIAETTARKQLNALQVALGQKQSLQSRYTDQATRLRDSQEALSEHYRKLAKYSNSLGGWIVPPNPFADALHALRARCDREMQAANEQGILKEQEQLHTREGASRAKIELCRQEIDGTHERITTLLATRGRSPAKDGTHAEIVAVWPLVGEHSPQDRARLESEIVSTASELRKLEQLDLSLSEKLGIGKTTLDLEQSRRRLAQQERVYATKERAGLLIAATFDRLMRKMLPRTEFYMQQLLPVLTRGRYHDVSLTTEPEEGISSGGPLQVGLWEPAAKEYIPLASLSGGIADQVSLALRLAFAIAALPRELNVAPGFLLLDEPLHLANPDRAQSLVEIVVSDQLGQHFEQILFVSHDTPPDASRFPYRVSIDNGQVIESNLPTAPAMETIAVEPEEEGGNGNEHNYTLNGSTENMVLEAVTIANP
ncbi:MAG TPA: AAA family ATPase [Ktedonobacteraceae bacterium]|nr:AAA family ATPase [Ktedonobacteraceae bacterium]